MAELKPCEMLETPKAPETNKVKLQVDKGMGNQQELELAWLAGMMNGDGCFSLQLRKVDKRWKCDVSVTLTQTDPDIINRALMILEEQLGFVGHIQQYPPSGAGRNTKYNLRIRKMSQIARLIAKIEPYMCGRKKAQALLLFRYVVNRLKYAGKNRRKYTIENDPEAIELAAMFYKMNGKAIPKELLKVLRDYPFGSRAKRLEAHGACEGDDIVPSVSKDAAATQVAAQA